MSQREQSDKHCEGAVYAIHDAFDGTVTGYIKPLAPSSTALAPNTDTDEVRRQVSYAMSTLRTLRLHTEADDNLRALTLTRLGELMDGTLRGIATPSATAFAIPLLEQAAMQLQWAVVCPEHRDVHEEWVKRSAALYLEIADYLNRQREQFDIQREGKP